MDYRLLRVLLVASLVVAVAAGGVRGKGRSSGHSHMFAFADNSSACCATLYILDGDSVSQDMPAFGPVPAAARAIAHPSDPIVGLAWAPDGNSIAYLVGRRVLSGNYNVIDTVDLWRVRIADGTSDLVAHDVASSREQREYRLDRAILWIGGNPFMAQQNDWRPVTREPNPEFRSPDKKLAASRESGVDSNWICVRPPQQVPSESVGPGCFGDGFFSLPAWAPF
ncbi:MAG: hypothetical protein EPO22_04120 [Dehalococcoidia bacterium]|nr:MAG: hypothetical protein EPO22_04120 [Dehalococcoidia bacterium]